MITVYGTPLCKDCLAMKIIFEQLHVQYKYINITENTKNLKEYMNIREKEDVFKSLKEKGGVGIPYFVDGERKTFDINVALSWENLGPVAEEELERITLECELLNK